eukprot:9173823-Alexandrium_andersonii.AAC.1
MRLEDSRRLTGTSSSVRASPERACKNLEASANASGTPCPAPRQRAALRARAVHRHRAGALGP